MPVVMLHTSIYLYTLLLVPKIKISNMTVFENDGTVSIQVERSEGLKRRILMNVATVDGTALGKICLKQHA